MDIADQYHEISDLLMRFATLEATNGDLRQQAKGASETNEATRAELQTYATRHFRSLPPAPLLSLLILSEKVMMQNNAERR